MRVISALLVLAVASATIVQERITYRINDGLVDQEYDGFIAFDDALTNLPGLVLHHTFFGEGHNEDYYATFWAQQGFFAFAADIFGKGIRPESVEDAQGNLTFLETNPEVFRTRLEETYELMFDFPQVSRRKGGATMGFCLGGDSAFELSRLNPRTKLHAMFAFHPSEAGVLGTIAAPDMPNTIPKDVWVQAHKGTADMVSTNEDILQLEFDLEDAGVTHYTTFVYGTNVQHGFSLPFEDAYDQAAADQAMRSTGWVLRNVFPKTFSPFLFGQQELPVPDPNVPVTWPNWASLPHQVQELNDTQK